jgi:integrase
MTRLQADVDKQRAPETAIPLRQALAEWLTTTEIEATTRRTYVGYIERTIDPAVGSIAIDKLSVRHLETLYAELRRCRLRCDGRPFIERHRTDNEHDCSEKKRAAGGPARPAARVTAGGEAR